MAEHGYPSVYVVDSCATRPPLPPRLNQRKQSAGPAQTLLFLLVSVALCGMAIEGCLIYHLYQVKSDNSASSSKLSGGEDFASLAEQPSYEILPSKPVAHLTDGQDVAHGKHIMAWSTIAEPLLYEIGYQNRSLVIQKEGYYYVYSKVYFSDDGIFHHSVNMQTQRYSEGSITLLQSRNYSPRSRRARSNSYLGGVFHLYQDDAIYVEVSNASQINRHKSYENVFGAYMI